MARVPRQRLGEELRQPQTRCMNSRSVNMQPSSLDSTLIHPLVCSAKRFLSSLEASPNITRSLLLQQTITTWPASGIKTSRQDGIDNTCAIQCLVHAALARLLTMSPLFNSFWPSTKLHGAVNANMVNPNKQCSIRVVKTLHVLQQDACRLCAPFPL